MKGETIRKWFFFSAIVPAVDQPYELWETCGATGIRNSIKVRGKKCAQDWKKCTALGFFKQKLQTQGLKTAQSAHYEHTGQTGITPKTVFFSPMNNLLKNRMIAEGHFDCLRTALFDMPWSHPVYMILNPICWKNKLMTMKNQKNRTGMLNTTL